MDISSLERLASNLERSLDSWGFWLTISTLAVVIGLVFEYWYEVKRLVRERPFRWKAFQELMGAVLVTVGVAGELFIQAKSSKIETAIRDVNHNIEASLNKQAGDAKREASDANERAAQADERAAGANRIAEAERLERVKLERMMLPRTLSEARQRSMSDACRPFSGHSITVFSFSGDAESARLALQIVAALENAKIRVQRRVGVMILVNGAPFTGIAVSAIDPGLAKAISDSLIAADISAMVNPARPDEKEMTMTVGVKPYELLK